MADLFNRWSDYSGALKVTTGADIKERHEDDEARYLGREPEPDS
jgi:hypothetical protein